MEFVFTEEQDELRRTLRRFLESQSSEADVRRLMVTDTGYDTSVWTQLTEHLGLTALAVPEKFGGLGYSFIEVSIALEEMGRVLLCAPFLSSVLTASALLNSADEAAQAEWLPGIAAGTTLGSIAFMEGPHDWDGAQSETLGRRTAEGWTLDGGKKYVLDGTIADLILVLAQTDGGLSWFAVNGSANGLTREALPTMDLTRKQADLTFAGTPARLVGQVGDGAGVLSATLDLAAAAVAAEQVGAAQRVLEMSVDYAKMRVQFGRPIGSFQAIKHKCADMFLAVESARSAAQHAAWAAADNPSELPIAASIAKAHCSDAFASAAGDNIQIHGGIGFTWEHPAHLYFKRAKSAELMFGDPVYHRDLIARRLGVAS